MVVNDLVVAVSMFEGMKHCEMDWKWRRKDRQREGALEVEGNGRDDKM